MAKHILVFDSGVGGLSVVKHAQARLPQYRYSYLFDNQYFPYGELEEAVLVKRVEHLLVRASRNLKPDLIVIACNSASTVALPRLRACLSVPIVGVVPAIKPAAERSVNRHIGLLATPGTVKRAYTEALVANFAADCRIEYLGSTRLVELAELKMAGAANVAYQQEVKHILLPWQSMLSLDCVVLGCTHFPLLKDEIVQALEGRICCVDSGEAIARRVESLLSDQQSRWSTKQSGVAYFTKPISNAHLIASFAHYGFSDMKGAN